MIHARKVFMDGMFMASKYAMIGNRSFWLFYSMKASKDLNILLLV